MDVSDLSGRTAVVTGAGSGIGRATALALAERGADLAICDLEPKGLDETADRARGLGRSVSDAILDVASREQMADFASRTLRERERVDILINNAGIGVGGPFLDVPLEEWDRIVGINLLGVVHGCHLFLPHMVAAGRGGHVVNIASMAGYVATPSMSAYAATKFAVVGLSESLRAELASHDIGVTAVCPGVINTPIVRASRMYGPDATPENMERGAAMFERRNYTPERVARGILKAIARNRGLAPISPEAWFGYYLKRWLPGALGALNRWGVRRAEKERAQGQGS